MHQEKSGNPAGPHFLLFLNKTKLTVTFYREPVQSPMSVKNRWNEKPVRRANNKRKVFLEK
jgi:hypothetical protein